MHIFNEKTVADLELIDKNDTAVFASAVTIMELFKYQNKRLFGLTKW